MDCHPFIADGSLFELCGIHKKMIAWCTSTFCHGFCTLRWAIFHHIWGPIVLVRKAILTKWMILNIQKLWQVLQSFLDFDCHKAGFVSWVIPQKLIEPNMSDKWMNWNHKNRVLCCKYTSSYANNLIQECYCSLFSEGKNAGSQFNELLLWGWSSC